MATTEEILSWSPPHLKRRIAELERERDESGKQWEEILGANARLICERDEARAELFRDRERRGVAALELRKVIEGRAQEEAFKQTPAMVVSLGPAGVDDPERMQAEAIAAIRALKENTDG